MVGTGRIELPTSVLSGQRSTTELRAQTGEYAYIITYIQGGVKLILKENTAV